MQMLKETSSQILIFLSVMQYKGPWRLKPSIQYFQLLMSTAKPTFPHCREKAYLLHIPVYPASSITSYYIILAIIQQFGNATTLFHLKQKQKPPTDFSSVIHLKTNPVALKTTQFATHVMILGEESGKTCTPRSRGWDGFLQQCPQLVQLQSVRKFHLDFHCLPHSIPHYICNCLREAHH